MNYSYLFLDSNPSDLEQLPREHIFPDYARPHAGAPEALPASYPAANTAPGARRAVQLPRARLQTVRGSPPQKARDRRTWGGTRAE